MSLLKTFLKNARKALAEKDNAYCISQCQSALEIDSDSYNAYVFLGLAYTNMADYVAAQKNYERAIKIEINSLLGWQGLLNMFEKSGNVTSYIDTASRVAALHAEAGDEQQCLSVIEKAIAVAKSNGSATVVAQSLRLILPVSPFFASLQDKLPRPADTYVEVAELLEDEEATQISSAIAKGRTRLGVKLDNLTKEVKCSVYAESQLESIYGEIINWSLEESVRREAERKLLARKVDKLESSPPREKAQQVAPLMVLARGMTVVNVPDFLAWQTVLEWSDFYLENLDLAMIVQFTCLFRDSTTAQAIHTFLHSSIAPFEEAEIKRWEPESQLKNAKEPTKVGSSIVISRLLEVYEENTADFPLLCARILLYAYIADQDWASAMEFANFCKEKINSIQLSTSISLSASLNESNFQLATAMTAYRAPRFHTQAMELYDEIVSSNDQLFHYRAMVGKAKLLRLSDHFLDARTLLTDVLEHEPENAPAQLELVQCMLANKENDSALNLLTTLSTRFHDSGDRSLLASIYYSIGRSNQALAQSTQMYAALIQSLRYDPNYAAAYTALGLYYADDVHDHRRAEKCFQKALELSATEIVSAERLAAIFADDADWELVQIIAERVIQGNEFLKVAWPHRAIGFVHLNNCKFQEAVSAFQAGLRLATHDVDAWIGLGEAYIELGRFTAAEKAFGRACLLDEDNWHAKYLGATVASALGQHESACYNLEQLVDSAQSLGIRSTLAASYISWARALLNSGSISMAVEVLAKCLSLASNLAGTDGASASFEIIGQASFLVAKQNPTFVSELLPLLKEIESMLPASELLSSVLPSSQADLDIPQKYAKLACTAHVHCIERLDLSDTDEAVAWYNVGSALQLILPYSDEGLAFRASAIEALKCAVKLDPVNDTYWSLLGTTVISQDEDFGQHCLIKAITIDSKSSLHWTNLGFFYWKVHHLEAANQAFQMAQTLDPSDALAWLGQACLARDLGESDPELFEHALSLGSAISHPILAHEYIESNFQRLTARKGYKTSQAQESALWALQQANKCSSRPDTNMLLAYHRFLLLESGGTIPDSMLIQVSQLADTIELAYEEDESEANLQHYCDVKAVLARLHLRTKSYQEALDTAGTVLELEPTNNHKSVISCSLVASISQYQLGEQAEAIATLSSLHEEHQTIDTLITLTQVLISSSDEKNVEIALNMLKEPENQKYSQAKLLYAATVASRMRSNKHHVTLARQMLNELESDANDQDRAYRDVIERLLEDDDRVLLSQVHHDPENTKSWLKLSETMEEPNSRQHCMNMALHSAHENNSLEDLVMVCRASDDVKVKVVGLHLAPDAL
ncbi:putative Antiviral protein [Taphrina deformans PYCC 5710]|uniref:Antiviral protein n=1 Tax=Taphrina deformans (strain PYCC 5710 / ATCC 11124 / CBS 356.35 / IMI 108563 / JCM 9778 / NBRC 8474) TaxID=1097556 RepID=R4X962_TAPDE|nr:putative Antiviral protein [Taphrina deformans PYCC 5710]|eukprot:CCG80707.1 putative Antiviral protein [Taphrina deformans PYCC 5710]